jgi:P27 family predicted phage terminase small subunit
MTDENHPAYRLPAIPEAPDGLSDGARRQFDTLVPIIFELRTARQADLPAIGLMCEILGDCEALQQTIHREGITVTSSGGPKPHPALRNLDSARRQAVGLLNKFGLLPDSKAKMAQRWQNPTWHKLQYGE